MNRNHRNQGVLNTTAILFNCKSCKTPTKISECKSSFKKPVKIQDEEARKLKKCIYIDI